MLFFVVENVFGDVSERGGCRSVLGESVLVRVQQVVCFDEFLKRRLDELLQQFTERRY